MKCDFFFQKLNKARVLILLVYYYIQCNEMFEISLGNFIGNWFGQSKLSSHVSDLNYHYYFVIVFLFLFPTEFDPDYQRMKEERNKKLRKAFGNFIPNSIENYTCYDVSHR